MSPATDASQAEARTAILAATESLLAQTPLQDLSVAQIITEAGISRATFYFYFSSKFAVVAALVQQAIEEIYAATKPTLRSDPGPAKIAALTQRIRNSAYVWDRHRPVLGATVENWQAYPELRDLSLISQKGEPNTLALPDHANRIQVTYAPAFGTNKKLVHEVHSILKPKQWIDLIRQIGRIPEPTVPIRRSVYAIRTRVSG